MSIIDLEKSHSPSMKNNTPQQCSIFTTTPISFIQESGTKIGEYPRLCQFESMPGKSICEVEDKFMNIQEDETKPVISLQKETVPLSGPFQEEIEELYQNQETVSQPFKKGQEEQKLLSRKVVPDSLTVKLFEVINLVDLQDRSAVKNKESDSFIPSKRTEDISKYCSLENLEEFSFISVPEKVQNIKLPKSYPEELDKIRASVVAKNTISVLELINIENNREELNIASKSPRDRTEVEEQTSLATQHVIPSEMKKEEIYL